MTAARPKPVVAIVPFGSRGKDAQAGWRGRQIARRVVERFSGEESFDVRPVFLVAMPEEGAGAKSGTGYLVFGSVPDVSLAAEYGKGVGATHAVVGLYREEGAERSLEVKLVDVESRAGLAELRHIAPPGELPGAEVELARWIAARLGVAPSSDLEAPPTASEDAYLAILEAMDHEVNATLLRQGDPKGAERETKDALQSYLRALEADPACVLAEERLLVVAAEALDRGGTTAAIRALEERLEHAPRSWRVHYLLGELRREAGELSGAILAWSHADALHPLRDEDQVTLARLEREADAGSSALARLRRIKPASAVYAQAQELTGTILADRGELPAADAAFARATAAGGAVKAWQAHAAAGIRAHESADHTRAIERYRQALDAGAPAALRLNLARALTAHARAAEAARELELLLTVERSGEVAANARRLRFGILHADLERDLELAGQTALSGPDEALGHADEQLARVLAAEPELWEAHFGSGIVARRRGDAERSERELRRVLELWPEQPDALHELGVALLLGERTNEAVRRLEAAAEARPDDPAYLADAGFAQLRAGNLPAARERLGRARELDAADPVTESYLKELARVEALVGRGRS